MTQFIGLIRLLRPRQWVKNIFLLAPLVFTGRFTDPSSLEKSFVAFLLFCVASSTAYVLNDIGDRERDRQHPIKRITRPLASGVVSVSVAWGLLGFLCAILFYGIYVLSSVMVVIASYLALNVAYTFWLKHQPILDIFAIAIGFVLRVYAGAEALDVPVSSWMFVTTLCLALYLAAIKRRQELVYSGSSARDVLSQYTVGLVDRYAEMAATGALVFYSLFVMSSHPELVVTVPVVLFGLFRYWYVVEKLRGGESPTDALLSDLSLGLTVVVWAGICLWVLWPEGK